MITTLALELCRTASTHLYLNCQLLVSIVKYHFSQFLLERAMWYSLSSSFPSKSSSRLCCPSFPMNLYSLVTLTQGRAFLLLAKDSTWILNFFSSSTSSRRAWTHLAIGRTVYGGFCIDGVLEGIGVFGSGGGLVRGLGGGRKLLCSHFFSWPSRYQLTPSKLFVKLCNRGFLLSSSVNKIYPNIHSYT